MTVHSIPRRRTDEHDHGHDAESAETCPLCGSALTGARYKVAMARMERVEKERMSALEASLKQQFADQQQRVAAKAAADAAAQVARAKSDAAALVEKARKEATRAAAAALQPKVAEAVAQAIQTERTKAYGEKLALEQQLEELKRRVQRRAAHDIGEPAEVDLHATLVSTFPEDNISRVAKGVRGADVVIEVIHKGNVAGKIILDSKDHARWSNKFTQKLRSDQITEGADFAILSTTTFPAGKEHVHVQDHIVVASPARVPALVELLRRLVIQNYVMRLSMEARNEKAEAVFAFITSPACSDLIERIAKLTGELDAIDRAETAAHEKVWTKRGDVHRAIRSAYEDFSATLNRIIGTASEP